MCYSQGFGTVAERKIEYEKHKNTKDSGHRSFHRYHSCPPASCGIYQIRTVFNHSGDAAAFMTINPAGTVVTVLLKGMLAGLVAGLIYKALEKKNKTFAVVLAGIACPIVNTGIFLAGCYLFFQEWLVSVFGTTGFATVVTGLVSVNFAVELGINMVLASVIVRVIDIGKKQLKKNS